jgi:hypothetical protein
MDVKEWMSYKCSDEGTGNHNIHNSSTHSHPSEEDRTKNCKYKRAFRGGVGSDDVTMMKVMIVKVMMVVVMVMMMVMIRMVVV